MRHITFQIYINLYKLEFRLFIIVLLLLIYLENWEKKKNTCIFKIWYKTLKYVWH